MQFTRFPIKDDGQTVDSEGGNFKAIRTPSGFDILYVGYTHTGQLFGKVIGRCFVTNPDCVITIDVTEMVDFTCILLTCAFENDQVATQPPPDNEKPAGL